MASYTEHLNLLKKNPATDGADTFNIETMLNENWDKIDETVAKKAELGADGKILAEQLPEMNYDTAGSAAAVQANLNAHTGNKSNPHGVTAAQVGADPAGSAAAVQANLNSHTGNRGNPHGVTAAQVGARADTWLPSWGEVSGKPGTFPPSGHNHDASNIVSGILPAGRGGTGVTSLSALAAQIAANGGCRIATGSYVGNGGFGSGSPNTVTCGFPPKFVIVSNIQLVNGRYWWLLMVNPFTAAIEGLPNFSTTAQKITVSWSGNNVSWYGSTAASYQLNEAGTTYSWVAFG